MQTFQVKRSLISGCLEAPPSKSQTLRAILFASLASGVSLIDRALISPDTDAMVEGCRRMGAEIKEVNRGILNRTYRSYEIIGTQGIIKGPQEIDAQNSGIVLRFLLAIGAIQQAPFTLTGDQALCRRRTIAPLVEALSQLGAQCQYNGKVGYAPLSLKGPITPGIARLNGEDSQPVSALLIALSLLKGPTEIYVDLPGERPWVMLTLDWLKRLGAPITHRDFSYFKVLGGARFQAFNYSVPGDMSSILFPVCAALITGGELKVRQIDLSDMQGDKEALYLLKEMGANIKLGEQEITVSAGGRLVGKELPINNCVDAVCMLAVMGCFAEGETRITGASVAKGKESDRLFAMTKELKKMGAKIEEREDGLVIQKASLKGAVTSSHLDQRVAMALAIAGLAAEGVTHVEDVACVKRTYSDFPFEMEKIGGLITCR